MKCIVCVLLAMLIVVSGCANSLHDARRAALHPDPETPEKKQKDIPILTPLTDFTTELYWDVESAFFDVAYAAGVVTYFVGFALTSDPCIEASYHPPQLRSNSYNYRYCDYRY